MNPFKIADLPEIMIQAQQDRWLRGERPLVESLVAEFHAETLTADQLLDLIYSEILLREQCGEAVEAAEYSRRFPSLSDDLKLQFEVHQGFSSLPRESTAHEKETAVSDNRLARQPCALPPEFELLRLLGRGGAGAVYLARDRKLDRSVAVKVLWTVDPAEQERLANEARLVAKIHHPNVIAVYGVGEFEGRTWMAQEYAQGGTLREHFQGRPFMPLRAAALIEKTARGVAAAQAAGVIHCDLSPGNVLIGEPLTNACASDSNEWLDHVTPKVCDFGLAHKMAQDRSQSGHLVGTLLYMPPELAAGNRKLIGKATDVYGLGAILFEMLTGRPPFLGSTTGELLEQIVRIEPVSPRSLRHQIDRDLETICLRCLAKDPRHRYATAEDLADDLRRYLEHRPIVARPVGVIGKTIRWAKRRPALAMMTASLLLTLIVGITISSAAAWIARQQAKRAEAALQAAKQQALAAEQARAVAEREKEQADRNAAETRRLVETLYGMLGRANPGQSEKPVLLATWIENNITAQSAWEGLSPEHEGKLRLRFAEALVQLNRQQSAEPHFRRAIEQLNASGFDEFAAMARRGLAMLLASQTAGWQDRPDRFQESAELLSAVIESQAVTPEMRWGARTNLAQVQFLAGQHSAAEQTLRAHLRELEGVTPPHAIATYEATRFLALILLRSARAKEALPLYRRLVKEPPQDADPLTIDEAKLGLAQSLSALHLTHFPEAIEICEELYPRMLARYGDATHPSVVNVAKLLAANCIRLGGQPKRVIEILGPSYEAFVVDDNTSHAVAQVCAAVHLARAQTGHAADAAAPALQAIERSLKLQPLDHHSLYMQLLLAMELAMQKEPAKALEIASQVEQAVEQPTAPPDTHYLRLKSSHVLYGIHLILGNADQVARLREKLPEGQVPKLPPEMIHPSLR